VAPAGEDPARLASQRLHQLQAMRKKDRRIPIGEALPIVESIIASLRNIKGLKNITPAGSLRRFQETIGDIDLLGTADNPAEVMHTFTRLPMVKEQYPRAPRIKYRCTGCKSMASHDQQVLEWGFYEWLRKNPDKADQVWENARIYSPQHEIFFFVGNLFKYRNKFLIISVLRLPKAPISKPLIQLKKQ
jgi:hypothetical protein